MSETTPGAVPYDPPGRWRNPGVAFAPRLAEAGLQLVLAVGNALLAAPAGASLRQRIAAGRLSPGSFLAQLRTFAFRLLLQAAAEQRGLLPDPRASPAAARRYWCERAVVLLGAPGGEAITEPAGGRWAALLATARGLAAPGGDPGRGLPHWPAPLWQAARLDELACGALDDEVLRAACRPLLELLSPPLPGDARPAGALLGPEELGAVHEVLLERRPRFVGPGPTFALERAAGHQRKTAGAYTTPACLVEALLDTALQPLLERARAARTPGRALLALRVLDPACGSGTFLVAAARRIAQALADLPAVPDTGAGPERSPLSLVVGGCLYGVDLDPDAVELCRAALLLEAGTLSLPGDPLADHVRCGNSLLGVTPAILARGLEELASPAGSGVVEAPARSRRARSPRAGAARGQGLLDLVDASAVATGGAGVGATDRAAERATARAADRATDRAADAWCASFLRTPGLDEPVAELVARHRLVHWPLAFPQIFAREEASGFDLLLGNPPWERIRLEEREWFATRAPAIAVLPTAAQRKARIAALAQEDPELFAELQAARRQAAAEARFVHRAGAYPLCGRGDLNRYALFAELGLRLVQPHGRVGLILPSGIATDGTTRLFFRHVVTQGLLHHLYDFENRQRLFPSVDERFKFTLLTLAGPGEPARQGATVVCFATTPEELAEPARRVRVTPGDLELFNPNTRTCPLFRTARDESLCRGLYSRLPVLWRKGAQEENPWEVRLSSGLHMAGDSARFRSRAQLEEAGAVLQGNCFVLGEQRFLPLYEAKMVQAYDHRAASILARPGAAFRNAYPRPQTLAEHQDPRGVPLPRHWVAESDWRARRVLSSRPGLLACGDITGPTNERTVAVTVLPEVAVGHTLSLIDCAGSGQHLLLLLATLNSFVFDYLARQKIGGIHLPFFLLEQLPVPRPEGFQSPCPWAPGETLAAWVAARALRLSYTAWDLQPFAVSCGFGGPPFPWDEPLRLRQRCEIDAALFHLYGLDLAEVAHVLSTFPVFRRKEQQRHGEQRSEKNILELLRNRV
ncbi:MAG: hypothetical protein RBU45_10890 [Myxococcota bacterium]|nr:hypothetical protein [Myxococcota bacterium]